MLKRTATASALTVTALLGLLSFGLARELPQVTFVTTGGAPIVITDVYMKNGWSRDGGGPVVYGMGVDIGGTEQSIPIELVARADIEGKSWRVTLKDGRVFFTDRTDTIVLRGVNQFGNRQEYSTDLSYSIEQWDFVAVIFDPDAVEPDDTTTSQPAARADVDSVTLRNGDILSGTILTGEFTVQASYGTLTFTSEQLASIAIEDSAGRTDQFVLQVGDRVSGVLQNATIEIALTTGATITLEKGNIASITFATED